MFTTGSRVVFTTHDRVDTYHQALVAAVYDDVAGKALVAARASLRRLRCR